MTIPAEINALIERLNNELNQSELLGRVLDAKIVVNRIKAGLQEG